MPLTLVKILGVQTSELVLAPVFGASNLLMSVHPVAGVVLGVETASGFSTFNSLVDFFCWCVLNGHVEFLVRLVRDSN